MYLEKMRLETKTSILELSEGTGISMFKLSKILTLQECGTVDDLGKMLFFLRNKSTDGGYYKNKK